MFLSYLRIEKVKDRMIEAADITMAVESYARYMERSINLMGKYIFITDPYSIKETRSEFAIASYKANHYLNLANNQDEYISYLLHKYYDLAYEEYKNLINIHDKNLADFNFTMEGNFEKFSKLAKIEDYQEISGNIVDYLIAESNSNFYEAYEVYEDIWNQTITLFILGLITCLVAGILISESVSKPIRQLTDITKKIKQGDLNAKINYETDDEIGYLLSSFKDMVNKLKDSYDVLLVEKKKLQRSNKVKDEFLSNISHELKTPLTSIKSYAEILENGILGKINNKQKESLKIIDESTNTLLTLINSLLEISAYENEKVPLKRENADVIKLITEVIKEFKNMLASSNASIKIISKYKEIYCKIDIDKTKEVFRNIISNSIKYRDEKRTQKIEIRFSEIKRNNQIKISIKDTGIGISKKELNHVFDKFYQVDESMTRKVNGTGLGLAITKLIMKSSKGDISIKSSPGKGTEVILIFPCD